MRCARSDPETGPPSAQTMRCLPEPPGGWGALGGRLHCRLHPGQQAPLVYHLVGGGDRRSPEQPVVSCSRECTGWPRLLFPQPGESQPAAFLSFFQCHLEHRDCDEGNSWKLSDPALSCQRAGLRVGHSGLPPWLSCSRAQAELLGSHRLLRGMSISELAGPCLLLWVEQCPPRLPC